MVKKLEKKYIPLATFFAEASQNEVTLTYTAIENIVGQQLPNAAYLNSSWWKKNNEAPQKQCDRRSRDSRLVLII